jgi:hydrogenase nickel incorporation protein HypB
MCKTCGCSGAGATLERYKTKHSHHHDHQHVHDHDHNNDHEHPHQQHHHDHHHDEHQTNAGATRDRSAEPRGWSHDEGTTRARIVQIEQDILSKNNAYAEQNRALLHSRKTLGLNLISSPGSGKTTLLVRTIEELKGKTPVIVVEGDQQTSRDADRIRATGAPALQINTGKGCHLDAHLVGHAMLDLGVPEKGIVFIENVGNLVCPADFDLGEAAKVVILSVTEGEDKPIKYPTIFANAKLMILNKVDLLPYVPFKVEECIAFARQVNPQIEIIQLSSISGAGIPEWLKWIEKNRTAL